MIVDLGKNIKLDIYKLMTTRLLVQANSGGGKSYAIRKILEETHGKVQQIVLDIDGDFSSLREKFDFVLAGKGGDISADTRSAGLLARRILELESNLIVDLYELKQIDRIRFVKNFLESMIDAPKSLWHPTLVVLDEAHIFCPEKGHAESWSAVVDVATRGRKRGYCLILATQRLAKLHKDAAAEMNNKMIGRTTLDVDLKRAGDELGFHTRDWSNFKNLEPGEFYLYGPALSKQVELGTVGEVKTRHPKAGKIGKFYSPAPSSKVKSVLAKLSDLPQEAATELKEKSDLQARIKELERELRLQKTIEPKIDKTDLERDVRKHVKNEVNKAKASILNTISKVIKEFQPESYTHSPEIKSFDEYKKKYLPKPQTEAKISGDLEGLGRCEQAILGFLTARSGESFSKVQVGAMTGYAHSSGGFNNALSKLGQANLISRGNGRLQVTAQGYEIGKTLDVPHTLEDWKAKLGKCERAIYSALLEAPDEAFEKEKLGELTGYQPTSGGFNNALSRLSNLGLIARESGQIRLNPEVQL